MNTPTPSAHSGEQGKPSDVVLDLLRRASDLCIGVVKRSSTAAHNAANLRNQIDHYLSELERSEALERKHEQIEPAQEGPVRYFLCDSPYSSSRIEIELGLELLDGSTHMKFFNPMHESDYAPPPSEPVDDRLTVAELAELLGRKGYDVLKALQSHGVLATLNQRVDFKDALLAASWLEPPSEQAGIAHSNSCSISDEVVERAAKAVYDAFVFVPGCDGMKEKPAWAERGNSFKQSEARRYARAALQSAFPRGAGSEPVEMSPEFTDSARGAIAWVLYHHQGGNSAIGQPLRDALGIGAHEPLPESLIAEAKRYASAFGRATADFHSAFQRVVGSGALIAADLDHEASASESPSAANVMHEAADLLRTAHPAPEAQAEGELVRYLGLRMLNIAYGHRKDEANEERIAEQLDGIWWHGGKDFEPWFKDAEAAIIAMRPQPSASETPSARDALARISLTSQNNMSPAHVLLAECGKIAREAIAAQRKEGE